MTTIVNTPSNGNDSSGVGLIVGIIVLIVAGALFFMYVLPMMQGQNTQKSGIDVNVTLPKTDTVAPQQ